MNRTAMKPDDRSTDEQVIPGKTPFIYRNIFAYFVLFLSFGLGGAIYLALARIKDVSINSELIVLALFAALLTMGIMLYLVGVRLFRIWQERKARQAGAQLHLRLAILFAGIAAIPSILVALFAVSILDQSLRGWFAERISTAVSESVDIANSYYDEHAGSVRAQLLIMANDINREAPRLLS